MFPSGNRLGGIMSFYSDIDVAVGAYLSSNASSAIAFVSTACVINLHSNRLAPCC